MRRDAGAADDYSEGNLLFLWHIFLVKPFAAVSLVVCLITIFFCFSLERKRPQQASDRFLIGVLGLLAVWQGLRILQGAGLVALSLGAKTDDAIELVVTAFYLMASLMLRFSTVNHLDLESAMRLARAAPPRSSRQPDAVLKDAAAIDTLNWAIPRLSDGAFRLFALLCLRVDVSDGTNSAERAGCPAAIGKIQRRSGRTPAGAGKRGRGNGTARWRQGEHRAGGAYAETAGGGGRRPGKATRASARIRPAVNENDGRRFRASPRSARCRRCVSADLSAPTRRSGYPPAGSRR